LGAIAKTVPGLALLVALAAEQHLTVAVVRRDERDDGVGLRKSGQVIQVAVVAVWVERIAVARDLGRGGHDRESAAALAPHRFDQRGAARSVDLVGVIHRSLSLESGKLAL